MWYTEGMKVSKTVTDYAVRHTDRADFKHTSGYAKAQNGENFGAACAASFEARKALNEQRKYVQGYKSSAIGARRYSGLKPAVYKPEKKTETEPSAIDSSRKRHALPLSSQGYRSL